MNSEHTRGDLIAAFLQEYWYISALITGIFFVIGALCNFNWLCDPTGTSDAYRHSRGYRRTLFFLSGLLLIVVGIWGWVLEVT